MTNAAPPQDSPTAPGDGPEDARPFSFRWKTKDGRETGFTVLARSREAAESSALRAGWPGHDGTRLGRFRHWLKQELTTDDLLGEGSGGL